MKGNQRVPKLDVIIILHEIEMYVSRFIFMRKKYLEFIYEGTMIIKVLKAWLQGKVGFHIYGLN
jgi:hypothetical protein